MDSRRTPEVAAPSVPAAPGPIPHPSSDGGGAAGRTRRRGWARALPVLAVAVLAGCDLPTSVPEWESTWVVPAERTTMTVAELLPPSVTIAEDGSAFVVSVGGTDFGTSLIDACPECGPAHGSTVPKPAFEVTTQSSITLPGDLVSASLASGSVAVELFNGFGFDPIRPSGTASGTIRVGVTSGGRTLIEEALVGSASESFPPNSTRTLVLALEPGRVAESLVVSLTIDSPEGDPVQVDTTQSFRVTVASSSLGVSEAEVRVEEKPVEFEQVSLDMASLDDGVVNRTVRGALLLRIENPFAVVGDLALRIDAPGTAITKSLPLGEGVTEPRIEFTGEELKAILGKDGVVMAASGAVSAPSGTVTLRPSQALAFDGRLELVLSSKEK